MRPVMAMNIAKQPMSREVLGRCVASWVPLPSPAAVALTCDEALLNMLSEYAFLEV